MATFNANADVQTLADVLTTAADAKGKLYSKRLEHGAAQYDDFKMFEGAENSEAVFYVKRDLSKTGGDKMVFTVQSDLAGPGVLGEEELTGKTSKAKFSNYSMQLDFHRDATEMTKKEIRFLAAGQDVEDACVEKLKVKLGRRRMYDMKMKLIRGAVGNIIRPGHKTSRDALTRDDVMAPDFLTTMKMQVQRIGASPIGIKKNKLGSPVYRYISYLPDVAMADIRNATSYQNAMGNAQERGEENPLFNGRLTDWMGIGLFEHIVSAPDLDDHIGDPTAPLAKLGTAFSVDSAGSACKLIMNSANTRNRYFEWFPGYDYQWVEGQDAVVDSATYYAWIVNPNGSVGFVSYVGSSNNGNQITLTNILSPDGAGTSTKGATTVGEIVAVDDTWDSTPAAGGVGASATTDPAFSYTDSFDVGAWIIPANAKGECIGHGFFFGKGAALRGYGQTDTTITQDRDYKFVNGVGFEAVDGCDLRKRTDGISHGYGLMEFAIQHEGIPTPELQAA